MPVASSKAELRVLQEHGAPVSDSNDDQRFRLRCRRWDDLEVPRLKLGSAARIGFLSNTLIPQIGAQGPPCHLPVPRPRSHPGYDQHIASADGGSLAPPTGCTAGWTGGWRAATAAEKVDVESLVRNIAMWVRLSIAWLFTALRPRAKTAHCTK